MLASNIRNEFAPYHGMRDSEVAVQTKQLVATQYRKHTQTCDDGLCKMKDYAVTIDRAINLTGKIAAKETFERADKIDKFYEKYASVVNKCSSTGEIFSFTGLKDGINKSALISEHTPLSNNANTDYKNYIKENKALEKASDAQLSSIETSMKSSAFFGKDAKVNFSNKKLMSDGVFTVNSSAGTPRTLPPGLKIISQDGNKFTIKIEDAQMRQTIINGMKKTDKFMETAKNNHSAYVKSLKARGLSEKEVNFLVNMDRKMLNEELKKMKNGQTSILDNFMSNSGTSEFSSLTRQQKENLLLDMAQHNDDRKILEKVRHKSLMKTGKLKRANYLERKLNKSSETMQGYMNMKNQYDCVRASYHMYRTVNQSLIRAVNSKVSASTANNLLFKATLGNNGIISKTGQISLSSTGNTLKRMTRKTVTKVTSKVTSTAAGKALASQFSAYIAKVQKMRIIRGAKLFKNKISALIDAVAQFVQNGKIDLKSILSSLSSSFLMKYLISGVTSFISIASSLVVSLAPFLLIVIVLEVLAGALGGGTSSRSVVDPNQPAVTTQAHGDTGLVAKATCQSALDNALAKAGINLTESVRKGILQAMLIANYNYNAGSNHKDMLEPNGSDADIAVGQMTYGIGRWDGNTSQKISDWCMNNGYTFMDFDNPEKSLEGQMAYIVYDLKTNHPDILNRLSQVNWSWPFEAWNVRDGAKIFSDYYSDSIRANKDILEQKAEEEGIKEYGEPTEPPTEPTKNKK